MIEPLLVQRLLLMGFGTWLDFTKNNLQLHPSLLPFLSEAFCSAARRIDRAAECGASTKAEWHRKAGHNASRDTFRLIRSLVLL